MALGAVGGLAVSALASPVVQQAIFSGIDTLMNIWRRHASGELTKEQALDELRAAGVNVDDAIASWEASKASHNPPQP